jgi:hypothetical protein
MSDIRLIVVDPGHFHAALVQKEMYPNLSPLVHVYAPFGPDLIDYLTRIARFNGRAEMPTHWQLEIHAGPDFLDRAMAEHRGAVAIFSGRNRGKIERIARALEAGLHVLADKPWIIRTEDRPVLEQALATARRNGLVAYDMMGGRHSVVASLQRILCGDPEIYGEQVDGDAGAPGVAMTSVHHILKQVAGVPNPRPAWFFDVTEQGCALTDVGTHLVDRVHGTLFPDAALDPQRDIRLQAAECWATPVSLAQFRQVTGETSFPDYLAPWLAGDRLDYPCNNRLDYAVRGVHVSLDMRWDWESPVGDDTHGTVFRGTRARIELRQGAAERYRPELYVVAEADIAAPLARRIAALQPVYPGLAVEPANREWRIVIPPGLEHGHDAHFRELTRRFLAYVADPGSFPTAEMPNMLAKYFVCSEGAALAR